MRRLRQNWGLATIRLLRAVCHSPGAGGSSHGVAFEEEPAKRAGECVLFLFMRRVVRGGRSRGVVLSAGTVSNVVYGRLQRGIHRLRHLVQRDCEEKEFSVSWQAIDQIDWSDYSNSG